MSGNRTKQEYNSCGSSSSRPGAERSDGSRGFSSGAAGARGRGGSSRGRGRGGGGSGRDAYHYQQQYDQQWMPPTAGSEWRGGRGRGKDDGDSGGRRRRRNQSKSARADSREEENAANTGAGSGGNGDKAGGEGADVGSGGGGGGGGGGSSKRARSSKGRSRSRQREAEASEREGEGKGSSGRANSVSDRRQAKLKELKVLDGRRKAAVAAGEALAKEVEKNRMEQDEIAIQFDAAKRLLALYDSNSDTPDVAILPSPPPPPPPPPPPAQAPRAEYSSPAAAASRSGSFSGAVRGRGGGSAAARGSRVSGSSPSLSAPAARSNGKDYPLGSTRVGLPGGVGGEGFGLITSMPPAGGGSGSGSGGSSGRNGASRNAVAAAGAAAASRKPPASVDAADEFPARVPSDGAGAGAGEGALDSGGTGPGRTSGSGVGGGSSGGSRETTGVHRGVEVNRDSFNIVKQLMFQTSRSRKPRTMAFNPVDPGLFAVCSADLSVDLWRYGRNKQELEKVSERNDVTPVGGAHMAWNPSGTHLAIGHSGSTLVNNWAATIIAKDGRRKSDMKLRSDRHHKPAQAVAWVTPSKNNQDHLVTGGEDGHVVIWTRVLDAESDLHKVAGRFFEVWRSPKYWTCPVRGQWWKA
ncbi:hypothetical protein Esi_0078_0083 [Ectocarpus siliculosus]|uniref:Uncharacterized protein n=1 Tax=Ectocarpus siliculosus TaxID=2880 RepID=D8LT10_ECTSI|nr:hypothetical protein Esi_0078_0083 [Ectocarpus siliculosus]|eukprot:CBN75340.1 hypothetical protein Esi_0078_0083 [Ectocarpus siliculosus]